MAEYIEKQAVISLPVLPKEHRHYQTMNLDDAYEDGWFDAIECVEKIPPADVRPVDVGLWLRVGNTGLASCRCGFITDRYSTYRYCPNCGSYNGGDADG